MDSKLFALVLVATLNPLVLRSPEPQGNVPANCEFTDSGPAPRVIVADAEPRRVEEEPPAPRRRTAEAFDIGALRSALAANDRAAFDAELARARAAGAQTRMYDDVARLWDAQFESPFFVEGSEGHRIASQYPGYETAMRDQVFTDARGRRFYPAAESRAFVARQAGVTLTRTGVARPAETRTAQEPSTGRVAAPRETGTTPSTRAQNQTATQTPTRTQTRTQTQPRRASATPQRRNTNASGSPAARRESTPSRRSPDPSTATTRSAAAVPAPVVPRDENTSSSVASPAAGSLPSGVAASGTDASATGTQVTDIAVTETTPPGEIGTTAGDTAATAGDTATPGAGTTTSAAPAPSTTATTTTTTESKGRSIVLPAILILIGLGVLILLFKTRA